VDIQMKRFDELRLRQLYDILKYDDKDQEALHLFVEDHDAVVGYLRLYPESKSKYVIGRVCIRKDYRKRGLGRSLVKKAVDYVVSQRMVKTIALSAQKYLVDFYRTFDFREVSDVYDDAGVPHVDMILEIK